MRAVVLRTAREGGEAKGADADEEVTAGNGVTSTRLRRVVQARFARPTQHALLNSQQTRTNNSCLAATVCIYNNPNKSPEDGFVRPIVHARFHLRPYR
jgi:hypothetical protein